MFDLRHEVTIITAIASNLPCGSGDGYGYGGGAVVTIRGTEGYRESPKRVFSISLLIGEMHGASEIAEHIARKLSEG